MDHTNLSITLTIPIEELKRRGLKQVFVLFHIINVNERLLDLLRSKFINTVFYEDHLLIPLFLTNISDYDNLETFLHFMQEHASVGHDFGELVYRNSDTTLLKYYFVIYDSIHEIKKDV